MKTTRREFVTAASALAVTGCAPVARYFAEERSQICLSPAEAREQWATITTIYGRLKPRIVAYCASSSVLPQCAELKRLDEEARMLGFEIERWINNPGVKPNYRHIAEALGVVAKIVTLVL